VVKYNKLNDASSLAPRITTIEPWVLTYARSSVIPNAYSISALTWAINKDGTGDPVTNTKNIQLAIDYAIMSGYDAVYLPKGTYLVGAIPKTAWYDNSVIVLHDGISLYMHPQTIIKLASNNYANYDIIRIWGSDNTVISGGQIFGDRLTHNFGINLHLTNDTGVDTNGTIIAQVGSGTFQLTKANLDIYKDAPTYTKISFSIYVDWDSLIESTETPVINLIGIKDGVKKLEIANVGLKKLINISKAQYDSSDSFILYFNGQTYKYSYPHAALYIPNGDTRNKVYPTHEFGAGITIKNSKNVIIENLSIREVTGDCIALSGPQTTPNVNTIIRNCILQYSRRNGLTLIQGNGVLVKDTTISYIKGTTPSSGIDIEPDSSQICDNVVIDNVIINNCYNYSVISSTNGTNNILKKIALKNCNLAGGFLITNVTDCFSIDNCTLTKDLTTSSKYIILQDSNDLLVMTNSTVSSSNGDVVVGGTCRNCTFKDMVGTTLFFKMIESTNNTFINISSMKGSNSGQTYVSTILSNGNNTLNSTYVNETKKSDQSPAFKLEGVSMNNATYQAGTGFTSLIVEKCDLINSNIYCFNQLGTKLDFIDCTIIKGDTYGWTYQTNVTYQNCTIEAKLTSNLYPFSGNCNYINCELICNNNSGITLDYIFNNEHMSGQYLIRHFILQNTKIAINGTIANVLRDNLAIFNAPLGSSLIVTNIIGTLNEISGIGTSNQFDTIIITQPNILFTKTLTILSDINRAIKGQVIFDTKANKFKKCSASSVFDTSGTIITSAKWTSITP